jgi:type II secretory pathway pseudopilin PulG
MRRFIVRPRRRLNKQSGMTMIEVLFAGGVMVVGFMGLMTLVMAAIASNNRNRMDSTGMMLTTAVLEQVNSTIVGTGTADLTDCANPPNTWTINTAGLPGAGAGAPLAGGNVDFSQSTVNGYYMRFVVGGGGSGLCAAPTQITYDVRWNVTTLPSPAATYLVTVSAMPVASSGDLKFFALPVTLRTYVGPPAMW